LPASAAASSRASWKRFRLASALTTIQARSAASGLSGARLFACLSGYLATMRKQGQALLATIETAFTG